MKLARAKFKGWDDIPEELRCCEQSKDSAIPYFCLEVVIDVHDISTQINTCLFCGKTRGTLVGARVISGVMAGSLAIFKTLDIDEGPYR